LVRGLCAIKLSNTTDRRRIPTTPALGVICGDSPCLPRWKRGFPHARTNGAEIPDGLDGIRSLIVPVVDTCQDPLPGPCRFAELRSLVKLRDCLELSKASIVQVSRIAHLTCVDGGSVPLKPSLEPCRAGPRCQRRIVGEPGRVRPGANEVCRRRPARAAGRPVRRGREGLGGAATVRPGRLGGNNPLYFPLGPWYAPRDCVNFPGKCHLFCPAICHPVRKHQAVTASSLKRSVS
jgi:hypothetical protein